MDITTIVIYVIVTAITVWAFKDMMNAIEEVIVGVCKNVYKKLSK